MDSTYYCVCLKIIFTYLLIYLTNESELLQMEPSNVLFYTDCNGQSAWLNKQLSLIGYWWHLTYHGEIFLSPDSGIKFQKETKDTQISSKYSVG